MRIKTKDIKEYQKKYRENHKEYFKEKTKKWVLDHKIEKVVKEKKIIDPVKFLNDRRAYGRNYYAKNKEKMRIFANKSYIKNRDKWRARRISQEIKIPENQICELCKTNLATQRHHKDYSKPYLILFVCNECHAKI